MQLKLSDKFIEVDIKRGLLENLGVGSIEIAITDKKPIPNAKDNIVICCESGKYPYESDEGKKVYVRAITHVYSTYVNIMPIKSDLGTAIEGNILTDEDALEIINKYK